jgi:hypothetical protein
MWSAGGRFFRREKSGTGVSGLFLGWVRMEYRREYKQRTCSYNYCCSYDYNRNCNCKTQGSFASLQDDDVKRATAAATAMQMQMQLQLQLQIRGSFASL